MDFLFQLLSIIGVLLFTLFCYLWIPKKSKTSIKAPPQPSGGFPVIGHLHLITRNRPLFHVLGDMADNLGPVFMLRLGSRQAVVISSWEVAKECFTINDKAVSVRPGGAAAKHLGYNHAMMGFAPYGVYWRTLRKVTSTELLSNARLDALKHVRLAEIDTCIRELYSSCNQSGVARLDMKKWFKDLNYNVVLQMVAGKRYLGSGGESEEARKFQHAANEFFRLFESLVPSDNIPFLEWMDIGGLIKGMKKTAREMDAVVSELVEEHKRSRGSSGGERDFIDVMLSVMDGDMLGEVDNEVAIKSTVLSMILAGTDTTTRALTWTLAHLLNHPTLINEIHLELDSQVGKSRLVTESDIKNLVYLEAVIKEAFRLSPPAELLVPREAMEDFTVAGFHVPLGTKIVVNAWKLQRDPRVWSDATEFRPDRFLCGHAALDVRGQHFELIPFGAGRRACPGISFALQVMHLTLARLFQGFELRPLGEVPVDGGPPPVMVEVVPRLPPELYR